MNHGYILYAIRILCTLSSKCVHCTSRPTVHTYYLAEARKRIFHPLSVERQEDIARADVDDERPRAACRVAVNTAAAAAATDYIVVVAGSLGFRRHVQTRPL